MKAKWFWVLLVMVAFPVAAWLASTTLEKRYTASMRLLVDTNIRTSDFPTPFSSVDDTINYARGRSAQSQLDILTGSNVLIDAIQRTAKQHPKAFSSTQNLGEQYSDLVKRISFDTSQFSDVITLRVTMSDPNIAADTANNIGFAYIDFNKKMAEEGGTAAENQLKALIEPIKERLVEIDNKIASLRKEAGVADSTAQVSGDVNLASNLEQGLATTEAQWAGAKAELASAEAALAKMDKQITASQSSLVNPVLQQIDTQLATARSDLKGIQERYLDDAPLVKEAKARVAELEEQRAKAVAEIDAGKTTTPNPNRTQQELIVVGLRSRAQALADQVAKLREEVADKKRRTEKYPELDRQIRELERDRLQKEATFQQLQQRLDMIQSTGRGRQAFARIVSTAIPPTNAPSFPDTRLFIFFGIGLGVVVSAFILMPKGDVDVYGVERPKARAVTTRRGQAVAGRNLPAKPRNGGSAENGGQTEPPESEPPPTA
jgi:uncharacterized protein involved in exopolysaccharide biosynthesis